MTLLTLAVVLFSTVAFVRTQMLKQEEPPIAGIRFDRTVAPGCDCPRDRAKLSFTLERGQPVTATIVNEEGDPVRTLLEGEPLESGRETISWDGTDDAGDALPEGDYRLRVDLDAPDRAITIPTDVHVEPQAAAAARAAPRA